MQRNNPVDRLPYPLLIRGRAGYTGTTLTDLLSPAGVTAFVGGGGKTGTMLALAQELAGQGARVIVTTTTHILPVTAPLPSGMRVVGVPLPNGKLGPVEHPERLRRECDFLLLESDGSRGLPVKAPADHEPALLPETELVIALQGMTAFGKPISAVCHRPERVCAVLGKSPEELLCPADGAALLLRSQGQRKGVGHRRYAVVLNQADGKPEQDAAREIMSLLPSDISCAMTAYRQKE